MNLRQSGDTEKKQHAGLILLIPVCAWASNFVVVRYVMSQDAFAEVPYTFLTLRFSIATACFVPAIITSLKKKETESRPRLRPAAILGLILIVGYVCQTQSLQLISAGRVAFITSLYVVLVPLWDFIFRKTAARSARLWAVDSVLAFFGLVLLCHRDLGFSFGWGEVLALLAMIAFSAEFEWVERRVKDVTPELLTAYSLPCMALGCGLASLLFEWGKVPWPTSQGILALLYVGIVATAISFYLQNWVQQYVPARRVVVILAIESPMTAVLGYYFLGESLDNLAILGGLLILLAAGMANWQLKLDSIAKSESNVQTEANQP